MKVLFFKDTATTKIYTLSLHDALPIYDLNGMFAVIDMRHKRNDRGNAPALLRRRAAEDRQISIAGEVPRSADAVHHLRSEEHTSELQSRQYLVCRLLLEKKTTQKESAS